MIELVWQMFEFGLCLSEIIIFYIFLEARCEKRFSNVGLLALVIICSSIAVYFKGLLHFPFLKSAAISMVIYYLGEWCLFKIHWNRRIVYVSLFMMSLCCIDILVVRSLGLIIPHFSNANYMALNSTRVLFAIISKLILFCMVWICSKWDKENDDNLPKSITYLFMLMFAISLVSLFALLGTDQELAGQGGRLLDMFICLTAMCLFTANLIVYWVVKELIIKLKKEKDYELIQYQNELLTKAVVQNKQMEQEWRKLGHDFNNHISCIDMLLQMKNIEKARVYIKNMNNRCQGEYAGIQVGNEIADAVINQKYIVAKNNHIDFKVNGGIEEEIRLEQMDLCAILSNSLDNAIEAAIQVHDEEKRYVTLDIKHYKQNLLLEIRNSVKENVETNAELATTKVDKKRHGIGMMSMRTTVEKYGGNLWWRCENNQFLLSIMVKNV